MELLKDRSKREYAQSIQGGGGSGMSEERYFLENYFQKYEKLSKKDKGEQIKGIMKKEVGQKIDKQKEEMQIMANKLNEIDRRIAAPPVSGRTGPDQSTEDEEDSLDQ